MPKKGSILLTDPGEQACAGSRGRKNHRPLRPRIASSIIGATTMPPAHDCAASPSPPAARFLVATGAAAAGLPLLVSRRVLGQTGRGGRNSRLASAHRHGPPGLSCQSPSVPRVAGHPGGPPLRRGCLAAARTHQKVADYYEGTSPGSGQAACFTTTISVRCSPPRRGRGDDLDAGPLARAHGHRRGAGGQGRRARETITLDVAGKAEPISDAMKRHGRILSDRHRGLRFRERVPAGLRMVATDGSAGWCGSRRGCRRNSPPCRRSPRRRFRRDWISSVGSVQPPPALLRSPVHPRENLAGVRAGCRSGLQPGMILKLGHSPAGHRAVANKPTDRAAVEVEGSGPFPQPWLYDVLQDFRGALPLRHGIELVYRMAGGLCEVEGADG